MADVTETATIKPGSWRELLGRERLGTATLLAGGVGLYATNEFLTISLLPSAVAEIGGQMVGGGGRQMSRGKGPVPETRSRARSTSMPAREGMARADLAQLIQDLNEQMLAAARELQFELAARIRDEVSELKKELRGMDAAGVK